MLGKFTEWVTHERLSVTVSSVWCDEYSLVKCLMNLVTSLLKSNTVGGELNSCQIILLTSSLLKILVKWSKRYCDLYVKCVMCRVLYQDMQAWVKLEVSGTSYLSSHCASKTLAPSCHHQYRWLCKTSRLTPDKVQQSLLLVEPPPICWNEWPSSLPVVISWLVIMKTQ